MLNFLKNLFKSEKAKYREYRKKPCPECSKLNWKYSYAPYYHKGKKCALEARICGNCGYKDTDGHILQDTTKLNDTTKFNVK